ncbi:MAG: protein kinase, partial [Aldersonia sp.]|nr:protein kinase [Aldersonia sp.]
GIVHRDIKPGNILVVDRGRAMGTVKISDFGIARATADTEHDTSVITGTPAYFAPEVARGADPTEASDVFSLGATLYTVVEGQPPFGLDPDTDSMLTKVAAGQIIPPQRSEMITAPLLHMLEPDPARRPTMAQARDELVTATLGETASADYLLGSPIRSADGTVPAWATRAGGLTSRRRSVPIPDRTVSAAIPSAPRSSFDTNPSAARLDSSPLRTPPSGRGSSRSPALPVAAVVTMLVLLIAVAAVAIVLLL